MLAHPFPLSGPDGLTSDAAGAASRAGSPDGLAVSGRGATGPATALTSLSCTAFRSYGQMRLSLAGDRPFVVLCGANGAGKTNILEAVSYLAPGRGLRGATLGDIAQKGAAQPWAVSALMNVGGEESRIGTGQDPQGGPRRVVRLDGVDVPSTNDLGDNWSILWLTPQMDRLFLEAPSGRRKFLDRLVLALTPDHSRQVAAFERAMRERNRLLADGYHSGLDGWLDAIEAQLAAHGVAVAAARLDAVAALMVALETVGQAAFPGVQIALDGSLEAALGTGTAASDVEHDYRNQLARLRTVDGTRLGTGPHKTDLVVHYREKAMPADQCSTGEQKALLIQLILAHAALIKDRRGHAPLLLLDEVAAHLDEARRATLFDLLAGLGSQCWLTGTDSPIFAPLDSRATTAFVHDGKVTVQENS